MNQTIEQVAQSLSRDPEENARLHSMIPTTFIRKKRKPTVRRPKWIIAKIKKEKNDQARLRTITLGMIVFDSITLADLQSRSRKRSIVAIRDKCIRCAHNLGFSSCSIGRFLNRNHASILHSLKKEQRIQ